MKTLRIIAGPEICEPSLRTSIRSSLSEWANFALALRGYIPARHHLLMMRALEALSSGTTKQLMVLMPPGSAKSTYASLLFPAWWIARNPTGSIITASHTASLAEYFGRGTRTMLIEHSARLNVTLRLDARAAGRFVTERGGEYFAIGVNGAVTGRRADLALIDDPVRSALDADSPASRDRLWNWYRSELVPRLKPNAKVLIVMTRWHNDDLAGRLLLQGGWTVMSLPALAAAPDALGRELGDALWPAWEDREALQEKQATLGERSFAALFQQAPLAESGRLFDISKIRILDSVPAGESVRAWDLAGVADPAGDPDWTVGVRLLRDEFGGFVVEDVRRVRLSAADVSTLVRDVAQEDGEAVAIGLARDPGQAGIFQLTMLTRMLAGYRVLSGAEVGSKALRAEGIAAQVATGSVGVKRAPWNKIFLDELAAFPLGKKDDQVDALARALRVLVARTETAHYATLPFIAR